MVIYYEIDVDRADWSDAAEWYQRCFADLPAPTFTEAPVVVREWERAGKPRLGVPSQRSIDWVDKASSFSIWH